MNDCEGYRNVSSHFDCCYSTGVVEGSVAMGGFVGFAMGFRMLTDVEKYPETSTENLYRPASGATMYLTKTFDGKNVKSLSSAVRASDVSFSMTTSGKNLNFIKTGEGRYTVWNGRTEDANGKTLALMLNGGKKDLTERVSPSDADGTLTVDGLSDKVYILTELTTCEGYSLLNTPITIDVSEVKDTNTGRVTSKVMAVADGKQELPANAQSVSKTDGTFDLTVNNAQSGPVIPKTGEIFLRVLIIAAAGTIALYLVLVLRKRIKRGGKD